VRTLLEKSYIINRRQPVNYTVGDLDECITEFRYPTYNVEFLKLKYCFVSIDGSVYSNGIHLVKESLVGPKHYNDYPLRRRLREIYKFDKVYLDNNEKYLIVSDAWSVGHYHWITEVLTRLILIKQDLGSYTLLLPDVDYVRSIGIATLNVIGLKPKSIIFIKHQQLYFAKTLYLISQVALTGYINDGIMQNLKSEIDHSIFKNTSINPNKKIYVSREKAKIRKVLNESEVKELFVSKGYDIITFEGLLLEEQIKICRQTRTMASIHGAGLTNMVFMPEGSNILEFRRSKKFVNQCYWHLADALNHQYYYIFGEPDSDLQIEGGGCNLTIPITKLSLLLDEIEKK
jgi:capsular polysaccharide biosynthesis protein